MAPFVAVPAATSRCLSFRREPPIGAAYHHSNLAAPAAPPDLQDWRALSFHNGPSRSQASTGHGQAPTSIAGTPTHRRRPSRQLLSGDCASTRPEDALACASGASLFFGGLNRARESAERRARRGTRPGSSPREVSPRAMSYSSSGSYEPGPRKVRHARDAPVTFGGWYREALADKRPPPLLGSLRPKQLQWMIRNFSDTELSEWADLAEEVLKDPVYQDRVEWTEYERRLEKDGAEAALRYAVAKGWVNRLDANAWDGVDPERIGTSLSRRIPRVGQEAPKATTVAGRTLQLGALAAPPQGTTRTRSLRKDAPPRRRSLVVSSDDQLQRRKERRMRQAERREDTEGAAPAGGARQAAGGVRDDSVTPVVPAGSRPGGGAGDGGKKDDSEWMPRTSSRDWLIQLVEKQEEAIEKEKKGKKQ